MGWTTERELAWLSKASDHLGSGDQQGQTPWAPVVGLGAARGWRGGASTLGSLGLVGSWPRACRARGAWHETGSWVPPGFPTPPWWQLSAISAQARLPRPAASHRGTVWLAELLAWLESWSGLDQQPSHPGDGSRCPRHGGVREHAPRAPTPRCTEACSATRLQTGHSPLRPSA